MKNYSDTLYWITSSQTKKEVYHLTQTQEAILRKLIHYSKKDNKITYSNNIISQHTFIAERTVENNIQFLINKGYLSVSYIKIKDEGAIKTRRTMYIKFDRLDEISALINVTNEIDVDIVEDSVKTSSNEIDEPSQLPTDTYSDIQIKLSNGIQVLVLEDLSTYWSDIQDKPALVNNIKKTNNNQSQFNYDLKNRAGILID